MTVGSRSGKTNSLHNLINEQSDIDRIYFYGIDLIERKYEYLIKKLENAEIKHLNDPNAFIDCSDMMDRVYKNINGYNPRRKIKKFDYMIADGKGNKKIQTIIEELFIRCRRLIIPLSFITQSHFSVRKDVKLNSTHYLIMKINSKIELKKYWDWSFCRYWL